MLHKILTTSLIGEKKSIAYGIALGIWLMVAVYAVLHDQYIVRVAPEHFTIYHAPIWGLKDERAIAAAWAFKASLYPGLGLGVAAAFCARHGKRPKVPLRSVFLGAATVILLSELTAAASGLWVFLSDRPLYPGSWYPEFWKPLVITQTIQLTTYLAAAIYSSVWLILMGVWRASAASVREAGELNSAN